MRLMKLLEMGIQEHKRLLVTEMNLFCDYCIQIELTFLGQESWSTDNLKYHSHNLVYLKLNI